MTTIPSGALAGAAASAAALARAVAGMASSLPLAPDIALGVSGRCARIVRVAAPQVLSTRDVGLIGADLVGAVQAAARGAEPGDASGALYRAAEAARVAVPVSASPVLTRAYALARALSAGVEVACLGEAYLAEARTGFSDRQAASEARVRIGASFEAAADRIAAALGPEVQAVLAGVVRATSTHLVQLAASLQPVVRVDVQRSYPSTALAFALYGDPTRAAELVSRNRCGTPLFMPAALEAVAPKA